MTTIQAIEKHYDKLTARERFALMIKADARGDESQVKALMRTAPRKTWSMPNTNGLADGFLFIQKLHTMEMLDEIATLYWMTLIDDESRPDEFEILGETYKISEAFWIAQRNILAGQDAFIAICKEYGFEASELMKDYPYQLTIAIGEAMVRQAAQDLTEAERADLAEYTEKLLQTYREAIKKHTKGWE